LHVSGWSLSRISRQRFKKSRQEIPHIFEGVGSHCQDVEIRFHLWGVDSIAEEVSDSLKTSWNVLESEGHNYPFEETELACKRSLVSVFFSDLNLPVARLEIIRAVVVVSSQISQDFSADGSR